MKIFKSVRNHKGFTLVELAIVLVIIGIILGAVLKGQELINNAKMKRLYNQQREIVAALYTYYDRYSYFPGDDPAGARFAGVTNGDGDGLIATAAAATTPNYACTAGGAANEQCNLWGALRMSNIIAGATAAPLMYRNVAHAYGGGIAVTYNAAPAGAALVTNWIMFQNIPGEVAQILDSQYDDGVQTTGSVRGTAAYTAGTFINLGFRL